MPVDRELLARRKLQNDAPEPRDPAAAVRAARAAHLNAQPPRAWAHDFYTQAEPAGLPLATLNDIMAGSDTLDAAMGKVARDVAAGQGNAALRKPAQADAADRIGAAYAKAHQARRPATRH